MRTQSRVFSRISVTALTDFPSCSNCLSRLARATSRGAETCRIYLNNLRIRPCRSCGIDPHPKHWLFEDDMSQIYGTLASSEAISIVVKLVGWGRVSQKSKH